MTQWLSLTVTLLRLSLPLASFAGITIGNIGLAVLHLAGASPESTDLTVGMFIVLTILGAMTIAGLVTLEQMDLERRTGGRNIGR